MLKNENFIDIDQIFNKNETMEELKLSAVSEKSRFENVIGEDLF